MSCRFYGLPLGNASKTYTRSGVLRYALEYLQIRKWWEIIIVSYPRRVSLPSIHLLYISIGTHVRAYLERSNTTGGQTRGGMFCRPTIRLHILLSVPRKAYTHVEQSAI